MVHFTENVVLSINDIQTLNTDVRLFKGILEKLKIDILLMVHC